MWPYTDDEARWLTQRIPANDNDPARRVRKSRREAAPPKQGTEA